MKKLFYTCILLIGLNACAQTNITSIQWQEDLIFLQQKIHNEYSNLFHKITKNDFDLAVEKLYKKIPSMQDYEVKVAFAELVALFKYGHTALSLNGWRHNEALNFTQLPYHVYWFSDGVYIISAKSNYKQALGARIVSIGDTPIEEALNKIRPTVSAENEQFFKGYGINYLSVPEILLAKNIIKDKSNVELTLEKENKQFKVNFRPYKSMGFPGSRGFIRPEGNWINARPVENTPLWLKGLSENGYSFDYIKDKKTLYVRQSTQFNENESIKDFYSRVFTFIEKNDVERLIMDVRLNDGGDNYNNKDVILGLIKSDKINQKGRFYVIIGRRTFSAAQNLVNEIENYTEAIFAGEPTAENVNFYGDARFEELPNSKLSVRLSWAWWQDKDPRDTRQWTAPLIPVELSFNDYITNYDPVIEAIFKSSDLELYFGDPSIANNPETFKSAIIKYAKDPNYDYYNFETRVNAFAYSLVREQKNNEAHTLFLLNSELYPSSANAWDSLAESYWRLGDVPKAKELYNKAITMDPNGRIGENAKNMLNRINN